MLNELKKPEIESERHFGSVLGRSYGTVQKWRNGILETPLHDDSIQKIARYRGMTPAQVRAWLADVDLDLDEDANTTLSLKIELIEEQLEQLQATMTALLEGPLLWVGLCIQDSLFGADIDWRTEEGVSQVMATLERYDRGQWTRAMLLPILRGIRMPAEEQAHPLAFALHKITGEWPNGRMETEIEKTKEQLKKITQAETGL